MATGTRFPLESPWNNGRALACALMICLACAPPRLCTYDVLVDAIRMPASCAVGHSNVLVLDMYVLFGTKMFGLLLVSMVFCIVNAKHVELLRQYGFDLRVERSCLSSLTGICNPPSPPCSLYAPPPSPLFPPPPLVPYMQPPPPPCSPFPPLFPICNPPPPPCSLPPCSLYATPPSPLFPPPPLVPYMQPRPSPHVPPSPPCSLYATPPTSPHVPPSPPCSLYGTPPSPHVPPLVQVSAQVSEILW